jgi:hypothetical protein
VSFSLQTRIAGTMMHVNNKYGTHSMRYAVKITIVLSLLAALVTGCASNIVEERPEIDRVRVFLADFDAVWAQLLEAVTTGEEELTLVDKTSGFISFQKNIKVDDIERYAFDDSGMILSRASANMVIKARPVDRGRTRVEINTKFTITGQRWSDAMFSRERQVVLDSKGWLEREYFDRLSVTLQGIAIKPTQSVVIPDLD